jgi:hypothetical protein
MVTAVGGSGGGDSRMLTETVEKEMEGGGVARRNRELGFLGCS